jgi:membrane associated rhomboid family serine protease
LTKRGTEALIQARSSAVAIGTSAGVLWIVHAVNFALSGALLTFGIHPRTLLGLVGILFAPFLHVSLGHLAMNTLSFALLGGILMMRDKRDFWTVSAVSALGSGLGAWLLGGPGTVHVGLSGVLFGYLGFLMARGLFERSIGAIVLSGLVTWLFGSMAWGVLPLAAGVSWQAHLFGFLTGVVAAAQLGLARAGVGTGTAKTSTATRARTRKKPRRKS